MRFWDLLQEVNQNRLWQLQTRALLPFSYILQMWWLCILFADNCPYASLVLIVPDKALVPFLLGWFISQLMA